MTNRFVTPLVLAPVIAMTMIVAAAIAAEERADISADAKGDAPAPMLTRATPTIDAQAIRLYDGAAPGSENWTRQEVWSQMADERWVRNVVTPTLIPVLPERNPTGAAVLVAPGGGFQFVSIDNEGYPIAQWLAANGVAAFVLKYRVMKTPHDEDDASAFFERMFDPATPASEQPDRSVGLALALADARAALAMIHDRADEWDVDPSRIGMLGFSAGALTTLAAAHGPDDAPKPAFLGYIYGQMTGVDAPTEAPPLFVALAADDGLFGEQAFDLIDSWRDAGAPVEFHFYETGGHGFGSYKRGATADLWFDQFLAWMRARGLLRAEE